MNVNMEYLNYSVIIKKRVRITKFFIVCTFTPLLWSRFPSHFKGQGPLYQIS